MHISCILAGTLLARLGRPEVANCIAGLKQYSYAYEEAGDQANEMSRLFNRVRLGELELNHMSSVSPRIIGVSSSSSSPHSTHGNAMVVDEPSHHRSNGSSSSHHVRNILSIMGSCTLGDSSILLTFFFFDSPHFHRRVGTFLNRRYTDNESKLDDDPQ